MFENYFNDFCKKYGYKGKIDYSKITNEYSIVISKNDNNAGAFLSKEELQLFSNKQLQDLLDFLHNGFKEKFQ